MRTFLVGVAAIFLMLSIPSNAQSVAVICNSDPGVWGRGDCALGRGQHGQWVRGTVRLLSNGQVNAKIGLETDSVAFGIGGKLTFDLLDANGKVLASGSTDTVHIPAKKPGKARIWESVWKGEAAIPVDKVPLVKSIRVNAIPLNDNAPQPFGLDTWQLNITVMKL